MTVLSIEAPSDAQLLTIRAMCDERDVIRPEVVCSKHEASEIIDALKVGTYDPGRYLYPFAMSDESIPF